MWTFPLVLCLVFAQGLTAQDRARDLDRFFVEWLRAHGEKDVVQGGGGVGVKGKPARLRTSIYGSNKNGNSFVVELEFRVKLPDSREIVEFVAGFGDTEDAAIDDCQINFTLTTAHVLYKAFFNEDDPHQTIERVNIGGQAREVLRGDFYVRRSEKDAKLDFESVRAGVLELLGKQKLGPGPHWIKNVYGQSEGKPFTVAATVDNHDSEELTAAIQKLPWPTAVTGYMAKEFMVVR
jgi:hypothetical protein